MVELALLLGTFSLMVFGFGLSGMMQFQGILGVLFLAVVVCWFFRRRLSIFLTEAVKEIKQNKLSKIILSLLLFQAMVNFIGALGPELGFDALWYHLTIPKIYLFFDKIFFIPGSLYYYSAMPKLAEMFYLVSLVFSGSGILAKIIHFFFGILSLAVLYNLAKKYLKTKYALLASLLFYSTLIVGWQSTTAYVDLARTFFELLALERFLAWRNRKVELFESATMLGLAVSVKLISFASLPVFLLLVFLKSRKLRFAVYYLLITLLIASPWLIFSYLHTGNPVYPIFSGLLDVNHSFVLPAFPGVFADFWKLLFRPDDPISPVFLAFLPVVIWAVSIKKIKLTSEIKLLGLYCLLSLVFWYLTPKTGGSRFILPYLPAYSLFFVWVMSKTKKYWFNIFIVSIILVSFVNIGYRSLANFKYLPVITRRQSQNDFLSNNLNFKNGDFYDTENRIKNIIKKDDLILVCGSHNLFYTDFPFIHESSVVPETKFSYVLTQNAGLPEKLNQLTPIYENKTTGLVLYLFGKSLNEY